MSGLTPEQIEEISGLLQKAPPKTAARVMGLFERVKAKGAQAIPAVDLLAALREAGVAQQASVARLPGFDRLFFEPFDGLIETVHDKEPLPGAVDRGGLAGAWTAITTELVPDEHDEREHHVRAAVLRGDLEAARRMAGELRALALKAIQSFSRPDLIATGPTARKDPRAAAVLRRMPGLLSAEQAGGASLLVPLNALGDLSEPALASLTGICRTLDAEDGPAASELMLMVMARLPKPWQAFRMPVGASHHVDDFKLSLTEFAVAGERILALCQRELSTIEAVSSQRSGFDAAKLAEAVQVFGQFTHGFERELPMAPNGPWRKRLVTMKASAANRLEALCKAAVTRAEQALPVDRVKVKGAGLRDLPRLAIEPVADKVALAACHLAFVASARLHAPQAGFGAARDQAATAAARHLAHVSECLLDVRHSRDKGPHFAAWTRATQSLVAALEGAEAAALFARRSAA